MSVHHVACLLVLTWLLLTWLLLLLLLLPGTT
jgi:hypothetical protein